MIEANVINWLDINEKVQHLELYGNHNLFNFFNFMRVLSSFKRAKFSSHIMKKIMSFLQIIALSLVNIDSSNDMGIKYLKKLSQFVFMYNNISDKKTYSRSITIISIRAGITILLLSYYAIALRKGKNVSKGPIFFLNGTLSNLMEILIGPIIQLCLMVFNCDKNGKHDFLEEQCYSSITHWIYLLISMSNMSFWIIMSILISIYFNEVDSINNSKIAARINCKYEIIVNVLKIVMFVFGYFVRFYHGDNTILNIFFLLFLFLTTAGIGIYVYHKVLFLNSKYHLLNEIGWLFTSWYCFVLAVKTLFTINDTLLFYVVGWIILAFIIYYLEDSKTEFLITDFNLFEFKRLKDIELFKITLLRLMEQPSIKSYTLLKGLIQKFEEYAANNPDINEKFMILNKNEYLKNKHNSSLALPLLSIIFIMYEHYLDKSEFKDDILINMCYFLINWLKNPTFAIQLCSQHKIKQHLQLYYKLILMEEIKEFFVDKLTKKAEKGTIKHVQIGSVILYNIYSEMLKLKIYEATCNQIEYFELLNNKLVNKNTPELFLKAGEKILLLRKEILTLWEKIVEINPFSEEIKRDFMLYLEFILEDDILAKEEDKKYINLKNSKLNKKNDVYHSMFIKELSTVILVDGFSFNGNILYTTQNFPGLFNFTHKEVINLSLNDLLPNVITTFHNELMYNAMKFSNIHYVFKEQKDALLKGKNGGVYNINLYVKIVPNLQYGLLYMVQISKIIDKNYIIVLDNEFKVNCLTNLLNDKNGYTMVHRYDLAQNICGHHIGILIPEIFSLLQYKNEQFLISKEGIDLKGTLYPVSIWKEFDIKVNNILNQIKQYGRLIYNEDENSLYNEMIQEIKSRCQKSFSIYYKIIVKPFLNGKFKYYRLYLINDVMNLNDSSIVYQKKITNKLERALSKISQNHNRKSSDEKSTANTKQIQFIINSSEQILLLDKHQDINNPTEENNNKDHRKEETQNNKMFLQNDVVNSKTPSSNYTKSSIDSANFNKLKNGIIDKKEISLIKMMKYASFLFIIVSIIFPYTNSKLIEENFTSLSDYLQQNLFFNHSKILVSCVYISTLNLKWIKDGFIPETNCKLSEKCTLFYSKLLSDSLNDIKIQKENSSKFYNDFKSLLKLKNYIYLDIYNLTTKDTLSIDKNNLLNFLISNALKLNQNLNEFYQDDNLFDINVLNILEQSLNYLNNDKLVGFNKNLKQNKINEHFSPFMFYSVIDLIFLIALFLLMGYVICYFYKTETNYLIKLIYFQNENFNTYLKKLDEIKKKTNNGLEDDENVEVQNNIELSVQKENNLSIQKDINSRNSDENNSTQKREKNNNANKHKQLNKTNKAKQKKLKLKQIMIKYFFFKNVSLMLKIFCVLFISFFYFIIVFFMEKFKKLDYLEFDSSVDGIEGVIKESFDIFISLKTELAKYENYEVEKAKAINSIHHNNSVMFQGNKYSSSEEIMELPCYNMKLPSNNDLKIPKLGNLLMPLLNDLNQVSKKTLELNELFNENACLIILNNHTSIEYEICSQFWSGIIAKGLEQSITQMGVAINSVLDELNILNKEKTNIEENSNQLIMIKDNNNDKENSFHSLLLPTSEFSQYEIFIEYYLFYGYLKAVSILNSLKQEKLKKIYASFKNIHNIYFVVNILLFFILTRLILSSKVLFNNLLNFVGILPLKYLIEDESLYKEVLKLDRQL